MKKTKKSGKLTCGGSWWRSPVALRLRTEELSAVGQQFFFSASLCYSFFFRSLLFSDSSSVFYGVLPSYDGAAVVGGATSGDRTLVPGGDKKTNHCCCFSLMCRGTSFFFFLHDCCSVARGWKKMARGWRWHCFKQWRQRLEREWGYCSSLLSLLLSPVFFFIPCFLLSGFKNNLPVLVFFFYSPLSAPFLYFVSLSKLLSTSPKSPLSLFCFTLFSVSFFEILPPLYFWFSPCIYRKQGRGPPYPVQAQGKVAWGSFCIAALEHGSVSFLYHIGRVLWV